MHHILEAVNGNGRSASLLYSLLSRFAVLVLLLFTLAASLSSFPFDFV